MAGTPYGTEQLAGWLDDAYAMESGLVTILQNHAGHFEAELPEATGRIREHIAETRRHMERLEQCLRVLNRTPSTVKSTASSVIGWIEGGSTMVFRDELVKDTLADYASEQFEVGCYTALVTAAMQLGYPDLARLCEENLREDQAMAEWLLQQLPAIVQREAVYRDAGSHRAVR